MNRLEKELKVLEGLGLKEGDKVKFLKTNDIYIIDRDIFINQIKLSNENLMARSIIALISNDWEKVTNPLGEKRCESFKSCSNCPLQYFNCHLFSTSATLFKNIEYFKEGDPELYEFIHKRLEKEVE